MASLLQGSPGQTTVSTQTPPWMQDAIYNTITWAQNLANKPYAAYEGPRVAGFTPTQQAGMAAAVGAAGAYQPYLGAAMGTLGEAAGIRTAGMIGGGGGAAGAEAAAPYLSKAAGMSAVEAAKPLMQQGVDPIRMAGQGSALTSAQPFLQQATGMSPLAAAQPYIGQAAQTFPGAVESYMNPYTKNVVNQIADLGVRQLQEKFLPAIGEEFTRAGQFGGSRMGEFGARALRDVQEGVLAEQSKALQAGYGQAADIFGQDVSRLGQLAGTVGQLGGAQQRALLEAGQTMGQLSTSDLQRLLQSGMSIADIGQQFGALTGQDASRLADIGATSGQLAGQDAARALQAQIAKAEAAGMDASNLRAIAQQYSGLGEAAQGLGLRGAAAISGVGEQEQNLAQRALDLAYKQYEEEREYPYKQLGFQAGIVGGFPASSTGTTSTTVEKPVEPSDLAKILASLSGASALYKTYKGT